MIYNLERLIVPVSSVPSIDVSYSQPFALLHHLFFLTCSVFIIATQSAFRSRSIDLIRGQSGRRAMSAVKQFKALVLGSGQGGTPLTMALAAAGYKVGLVEGRHIGTQSSPLLITNLFATFSIARNNLLLERDSYSLPSLLGLLSTRDFSFDLSANGDPKATVLILIKAAHASTKAAPLRRRWWQVLNSHIMLAGRLNMASPIPLVAAQLSICPW